MTTHAPTWKSSLARYTAWIASSALLIINMFLFRQALNEVMAWFAVRQFNALEEQTVIESHNMSLRLMAIDRIVLILLAVIGVSLSVYFEYYFRRGESKGLVYQRIMRVLGIQAAVALVCWLITLSV